ncbi:MAG: type II toxin-antitoxin system VapC family toxin [Micrococcales bacterium]|nr:type II toxin-antitoxin system VapC family toxin [Micrococcales bacterium]
MDTSVFLFAVGGPHPLQAPCRRLFDAAAVGDVELHVSVEALQEALFHRMRRRDARADAVAVVRDLADLAVTHPLDDAIMARTFELVLTTPLRGRDAVHAATALVAGFSSIATGDADFSSIPGLQALRPRSDEDWWLMSSA